LAQRSGHRSTIGSDLPARRTKRSVWTPTPLPSARRMRIGRHARLHGLRHNTMRSDKNHCVRPIEEDGAGDPVKIYRLRLRNDSATAPLASPIARTVLGSVREDQQVHIRTRMTMSPAPSWDAVLSGSYAGIRHLWRQARARVRIRRSRAFLDAQHSPKPAAMGVRN